MHSIFHEVIGHKTEGGSFLCKPNKEVDIRRIQLLAKAEPAQVGCAKQAGGHWDRQLPGSHVSLLDHTSGEHVSSITAEVRFGSLLETLAASVDEILIGKSDPHRRLH